MQGLVQHRIDALGARRHALDLNAQDAHTASVIGSVAGLEFWVVDGRHELTLGGFGHRPRDGSDSPALVEHLIFVTRHRRGPFDPYNPWVGARTQGEKTGVPGNLQAAAPSGVMPYALCTAFSESREFVQLQAQYHDGTVQRSQLASSSRRTFKVSQRLDATKASAL